MRALGQTLQVLRHPIGITGHSMNAFRERYGMCLPVSAVLCHRTGTHTQGEVALLLPLFTVALCSKFPTCSVSEQWRSCLRRRHTVAFKKKCDAKKSRNSHKASPDTSYDHCPLKTKPVRLKLQLPSRTLDQPRAQPTHQHSGVSRPCPVQPSHTVPLRWWSYSKVLCALVM